LTFCSSKPRDMGFYTCTPDSKAINVASGLMFTYISDF
jgi:hypothetical protein